MRRTTIFLLILASLGLGSTGFAGTLPATFFGMHINQSTTAWPSVAFGSYRLWDDGTAWANINTSKGVYNWSPLDSWVSKAQQHNTQLTYTFGRTPPWASSSPTTTCDYASGECVAPADYTNWDNFVTGLVTRYKGKIKYYEMWNEPNDTGFWKGTTAQMVELTSRAANIIHSIDPSAEVVSPGATWTSTTAWAWLDGFLSAGGGPYLDDIGFHGYSGNNNAETILTIIDNIQKTETAHGLALPLIITEGGWGLNTVITDQNAQAAFLVQRYLLITSRPAVQSFFWYQWDNVSWGTLWDSTGGIHQAGVAYGQVTAWLIGATANGCIKDANSTWTCSFTQANGNSALAVWNATASVAYTPGSQYTESLAIDGSSSSINGSNSYTIGNKPVLFTATSTPAPSATLAVTPGSGIAPVAVSATVSAKVATGLTVKSTSISFDDGTTANASSGSHTYANAGTYTVVATVTDSLNRTATSSKIVTVSANQPPQAALSVSPASGKVPFAVTASSAASKDPDGSIATSSINFGDGTIVSGSTAVHTYTTAGSYSVTATVKDNLGASSTATVTVTATANKAPVPVMTLTQTAGVSYKVSATGSYDPDGTIASTVINWGDGSTTAATSGSHTYSKAGIYKVTVGVTDNNGATASTSGSATASWGIYMVSPKASATCSTSQHFVAYAASQYGISSAKILVDGKTAYSGTSWLIDTNVAMASGTRKIVVQATDKSGVTYQSAFSISVQ
jgi:polysaccharide biosynthesis protein PslG